MSLQFSHYLDCLRIHSEETGDLKSFLNFNSGDGNYIYNQVYSPEEHLIGSNVDVGKLLGLSVGKTDSPVTGVGRFDGEDLVRIGYKIPFPAWSMVMDINPDFCDYRDEDNLSRVLVSTMDSIDSTSGFHVGINQANRLYIQYNNDQEKSIHTLPNEINANSVIAISQGVNDLSVYYKDLYKAVNRSINISKDKINYSDNLFIGGFGSNSNIEYTGYQGHINSLALISGDFVERNIDNQCDCVFVENIDTSSDTYSGSNYITTGRVETPIYETVITGYVNVTSYIAQANGGNIPIQYKSGVTGLKQIGTNVTFLTGSGFTTEHSIVTSGIDYDEAKQKLYSRYFLNFRNSLSSGEKIEIHTFDAPRYDLGLTPEPDLEVSGDEIRLYYHGAFNQFSGDKSYPIKTHEFDYSINRVGSTDSTRYFLSGYPAEDSYITYDVIDTESICIDFSGDWSGHRIPTGVGGYYPDGPQFIETGNSHSATTITITGILGESGGIQIHDRDVYLNGQKLMYGESHGYTTGTYTQAGFTGGALFLTSGLPGWHHTVVDGNGLPADIYTPEICFVPQNTGEKPSVIKKLIQNCTTIPFCTDAQYSTEATCLETDGSCSDTQYSTKTTCLEYDGSCSNVNYNAKSTCEGANETWTPTNAWTPTNTWNDTYETKAICEAAGGGWAPINGVPDPISGYSELIWLNGLRQQDNLDYRRGLECSLTNSFTIFEESPLTFYNNDTDILNIE